MTSLKQSKQVHHTSISRSHAKKWVDQNLAQRTRSHFFLKPSKRYQIITEHAGNLKQSDKITI